MSIRALIIVDYQNDFVMRAGALPVPDAGKIAPMIEMWADREPIVVLTQDWHRPDDASFKQNGGTWPVHCVAGTFGSFLAQGIPNAQSKASLVLRKQGYSAFSGLGGAPTGLHGFLRDNWVDSVVVAGVALDYCVRETAIDAAALGYGVVVPLSATKAVNPSETDRIIAELRSHGVGTAA